MDDDRMARDVEVLQQVMDTRGLTVKHLSCRSGLAEKSIYKYLAGVRTLPSDVIRAAFELTQDFRLAALVTGAVPVRMSIELSDASNGSPATRRTLQAMEIPPFETALPEVLEAVGELARCGEYLHEIMSDGKIDRCDLGAMDQFQEHLATAQRKLTLCQAAAETAREGIA